MRSGLFASCTAENIARARKTKTQTWREANRDRWRLFNAQ
jgi:hypothetical protein